MDVALKLILKAIENGDFNGELNIWFIMDGLLFKGRVVSFDRYQKYLEERNPESVGDTIAQDKRINEVVSKNIDSLKIEKESLESIEDWITLLDTTMFNGMKDFHFEIIRLDSSKITAWYEAGD